MGMLTLLLPEREVCLYFLKTRTSSHTVVYFKINKFYKIKLSIFLPKLWILGNKNNMHLNIDNIIT